MDSPAAALRVRLAGAIRTVREGMARVLATARSPDGLVTATVNGRGALLALELDPGIYRWSDAGALAGTILDTVTAATRSAEREVARLTARLLSWTSW